MITTDGTELFVTRQGTSRDVVVIVHGLGEHSGRYAHVADVIARSGWSVVAYDQRGHGRSAGARGAIPRETALLDDLAEVVDFAEAERLVLLGHSMGGAVAARFVAEGIRPVDALALSSPALALHLSAKNRLKLAIFSRLAPNVAVRNGIDAANLSHDAAMVDAYRADPLVHDLITPRLLRFMLTAGNEVRAAAPQWRVPTLLLWAGADKLVAADGSCAFASQCPPALLRAQEFPTLYHEIFNESENERTKVLTALGEWLRQI